MARCTPAGVHDNETGYRSDIMEIEQEMTKQAPPPDRWTLIRDIAVFQVKLVVDGLRDLILLPISLITGIISLIKSDDGPGTEFYDLLRSGRRSEHWINLFGAAERLHGPAHLDEKIEVEDIDKMVLRVESFVVDEYRKGGMTAQVKVRLDDALDKLGKLADRISDK